MSDATAGNANAAIHFVDRHLAEGRSGRTAFTEGERRLTYGQLAEQSGRMPDLLARAGLGMEDRVAMIVLDVLEFPVIFWGAIKAGVVPIAVNTLLGTEQYRYVLADSRAKALFVSAALLDVVRPILGDLPHLRAVFVVGGEDPAGIPFEPTLARCIAGPVTRVGPDETAFWLYSSGSTGNPKGVRHVHSSPQAVADTYGARVLGIREGDVVFSAAKFFFAYGMGNSMFFPMAAGATTAILPGRPAPDAVFAVMKAVRPTIFCGVPTLYAAMLAQIGDGPLPGADRLRVAVSAGEALPAEIGNRWSRLTGTEILDGVGSTEMLHIFLSNAPGAVVYGTSGVAVPGYEVRLVDPAGGEVADGEIGELLVRGPSAAEGYWNQRDKSRATFEGVWTRTGDKYYRRPDGRHVYCGRTDDMFKVSGQWVSPFEVEQALAAHPDVLEAAVVPALDDDGLEKPKAFVIPNAGATIDVAALQDHVKQAVGMHKYPRWIVVTDEFPKTATGKIQRFKLGVRPVMDWAPDTDLWIEAGGARLEARRWGPSPADAPTIVMLHEGLGCVGLWRDLPDRLAAATGWGVLAYSRAGYGRSDPCALPRPIDYMHREGEVVLPEVLDTIGFRRGVTLGHSDGGSIAALHLGGVRDHRVRGAILIAPHFFVEDCSIRAIRAAREAWETADLRARLARHHDHVDCAFLGWNQAWLDPRFRDWDITRALWYLQVPVLAFQGLADPYGTRAQVEIIGTEMYAPAEIHLMDGCGHAPHRDRPDEIIATIADFLARLDRIDREPVGTSG